MSTKAQEAQEPGVATVNDENEELNNPEFDAAFAEESEGTAKKEPVVAPKDEDDGDAVETKADPAPSAPAAPAVTPTAVTPPVAAEPPAPQTAMEKAEAEGAKLQAQDAPAAAATTQAAPESYPEGYENAAEVVKSEAFQKFFDAAPKRLQNVAITGGVDGMCLAIDAFNAHVEKQTAKAAAAANSGTASGSASARRIMAELGDVSITQADGSRVNVNEYLKEYGDLGEAMAVIADTLAEKRIGSIKPNQIHAASNDRIFRMEAELSEMRYWRHVSAEHSDAEKIVKTEAFKKFAETASPATKRLMASPNPAHGVMAIDAFKEMQIAEAKKGMTAPTEKLKALHSDTARGKTAAKKGEKLDDFDDGFAEALKQR
jgi:hypothetical protein